MAIALTLHDMPRTGDAVAPLRLFLASNGGRLAADRAWQTEAETALRQIAVGDAPGRALVAALLPRMTAMGAVVLPRADAAILCFACAAPPTPPPIDGLCRSADASAAPAVRYALTHPRADLSADAWCVVADDAIVAAAWWGGEGLAVETAPAYRRRGYARAAAAALLAAAPPTDAVIYRCTETNRASAALAASLGLTFVGREYRPTFRRANPSD